ncbi:unnamed protein product [Phyllotreta striolata]|uniref:Centrosomal protein of 135 kDa n=1 Tax=Phyllotreta striolata TaxID=444603 RepID=A0A9N9U0J9_PHYSR|nr:unnamed protein product [Phyllotreta striolata]
MERSFADVRKELDDLGYGETLTPDCLPLVRRLLGDLVITTDSLRKYMKISQQALEERDNLKFGAEPYKCDNAKLIKECNELHLAFIQFKEQHEKVQRDLRAKIASLETQLTDCGIEKQKLKLQLQDFVQKTKGSFKRVQESKPKSDINRKVMATADSRITKLNDDIKNLKDEQIQLLKNNEFLLLQLENRDQEIKRLTGLLEGGRPTSAVINDCCYKNIDNKLGSLEDEISSLKTEKNAIQNQLKESLSKQHEAMRRALRLAERNKTLEEELKDIDKIALSVEADCNNTVKSNVEKVTRLQDKINESLIQKQNLELEIHKLNIDKTELVSQLESVKLEKKKLRALLDAENDEKKRLNDRINNFTIIERDLNMEIDRLLRTSGEQKRKIVELESELLAIKGSDSNKARTSGKLQHKKGCRKSSTDKDNSATKEPVNRDKSPPSKDRSNRAKSASLGTAYDPKVQSKCCCEAGGCVKWMTDLLNKEIEHRQEQATQQIESLRKEKDFYMKEYHRLLERPKSAPNSLSDKSSKQLDELLSRIKDKDKIIATLQEELKVLTSEKYCLTSRLEAQNRDSSIDFDEICTRTTCKRRNRELDVHKEEVKHLERENDSLKNKIRNLSETSLFNEERMKKAFQEMEEHIGKLENERRDLVISQGTNRSNLSHLEDECRILREKLQAAQKEANNQKINYEQLKILHDQTNRALSDAQSQVLRAESEVQTLQSKMGNSHREMSCHEREIARLQGDVDLMKCQLTKIDREKDELLNVVDEKTERIDRLENDIREKKKRLAELEKETKDLNRKMRTTSEEHSSFEAQLRSSKQEIDLLQQDLENERRCKDVAVQENRRLQEDIASLTIDCKDARKELEITKRQVEDLKRQLQQYVAEVKRTEDLISHKEFERAELLDQFKSLSQENNLLETTNHTLESEASQTRVQLNVALDHASDLERKIHDLEAVAKSYEQQISELTSQIACLEIRMKQGHSTAEQYIEEMRHLKELCVKLDSERDDLRREIRSKDEQRIALERKMDLFSRENGELKRALDGDKNSQEGLERLLNEARRDLADQRLSNEEFQGEIGRLRAKIDELEERLTGGNSCKSYSDDFDAESPQNERDTNENCSQDSTPKTYSIPSKHSLTSPKQDERESNVCRIPKCKKPPVQMKDKSSNPDEKKPTKKISKSPVKSFNPPDREKRTKIPQIKSKFPARDSNKSKSEEEFDLQEIKNKLPPIPQRKAAFASRLKQPARVARTPKPVEKKPPTKPLKKPHKDLDKTTVSSSVALGPIGVVPMNSDHPDFKPLEPQESASFAAFTVEIPKDAPKEKPKPKFFTFSNEGIVPVKKKRNENIQMAGSLLRTKRQFDNVAWQRCIIRRQRRWELQPGDNRYEVRKKSQQNESVQRHFVHRNPST